MEDTVQQRTGQQTKAIEDMTLDELDELEDEEDDRMLQQYRYKWTLSVYTSEMWPFYC